MFVLMIATLVKIAFILIFALSLSGLLTWMERRQSAMMQDRIGPERAYLFPPNRGSTLGRYRFWGLIHPLADALKLATKEDFIPPKAHRSLFILAPVLALVPVLLVFAVIPFGPEIALDQLWQINPDVSQSAHLYRLQIAHIDIGILFIFAITSLAVYGVTLAGWASFNTYGLFGALRASAQMFSYEITMGMAIMGVFLVYGTLEPMALVEKQASIGTWGIVLQPIGFLLFFSASMAETKRTPFDLPEGESEIVGYFVEYSGTRFMTFYLAEFLEIVFAGALIATLFFGGWQFPGLGNGGFSFYPLPHLIVVILRVFAFCFKVFLLCFLQLTIRWSVPRMRYDQLMNLGWKGLLPASITNLVVTACIVLWLQSTIAIP